MTTPVRLLIVTQVYKPSHDAITQLLGDLAEELAARGLDVHVLTPAVNYMTGERLPLRERSGGVEVWRTPMLPLSKESTFGKLAGYAAFLGQSAVGVALMRKPDVVIYLSTPPMVGFSAPLARRLRGARTCFVAQDVYPEVPIRMGVLRQPQLIAVFSAVERALVRRYDRVVVLGERMRDVMVQNKGGDPGRVRVIPNWSIEERIVPRPREENALLAELGLRDRFVVQYSGNLGVVHDMESIVNAAERCKPDSDIAFLIIGRGRRRAEVERAQRERRLHNLQLHDYRPKSELPISLTAADVALVSLRPEVEGLVVPSKLYGHLAAGVPVIFIGDRDGEVARVIARAECGLTVGDGAQLAAAIRELRDDPGRRAALGANARRAFEERYGRMRSINAYHDLVLELAGKSRATWMQ